MTSGGRYSIFWVALALCGLAGHVVEAEDCQSWWDWFYYVTYTCDDATLGTYGFEDPYSDFPMPCCYNDDDVLYALYTRDNPDSYTRLRRSDDLPSDFSPRQGTVFVSHGWKGSIDDADYVNIRVALLEKEDYNVVMIDWPADDLYYPQSASDTRTVGALTGKIMKKLVKDSDVIYKDIWCIGHSLGAHVCGFAGRSTPRSIARITALDPAGPWFSGEEDLNVGVNSNDARFVDVIHTDTNFYGTDRAIGHMDFYVNGLDVQPNCFDKRKKRDVDDSFPGCSHGRSKHFFIGSITAGDCFISRSKCTTEFDVPGSCSACAGATDGVCAVAGYGAEGSGDNGIYYVETSQDSPYSCLG